jgi:hypothetical protein
MIFNKNSISRRIPEDIRTYESIKNFLIFRQVRVMVPGAERKLREQRGLSSEYLVRSHQKSPGPTPCSGVSQPSKGPGTKHLTLTDRLVI